MSITRRNGWRWASGFVVTDSSGQIYSRHGSHQGARDAAYSHNECLLDFLGIYKDPAKDVLWRAHPCGRIDCILKDGRTRDIWLCSSPEEAQDIVAVHHWSLVRRLDASAFEDLFAIARGETPTVDVDKGVSKMTVRDRERMREAGCKLAEAALYVIRERDGLHRLMLAVAEWAKAIADEGDRGRGTA